VNLYRFGVAAGVASAPSVEGMVMVSLIGSPKRLNPPACSV
jgi:hypothetical protein